MAYDKWGWSVRVIQVPDGRWLWRAYEQGSDRFVEGESWFSEAIAIRNADRAIYPVEHLPKNQTIWVRPDGYRSQFK